MLRPKNCKKCGGKKYQPGGQLDFSWYNLQSPIDAPIGIDPEQGKISRIQEMIRRGLIDLPNSEDTSEQDYLNSVSPDRRNRNVNLQNIGIIMQGLRTGLSDISGRVNRGRQNQYDYEQQAALGEINPMPLDDFQPNPYSLYAKHGGKLKDYQKGGKLEPKYQFLEMYDKPSKSDSAEYNSSFRGLISGDPYYSKDFIKTKENLNTIKMSPEMLRFRLNKLSGYEDASNQMISNYRKSGKLYYDRINSMQLATPSPRYDMVPLKDYNSDDSTMYKIAFNAMLNQEPYALRQNTIYNQYGIPTTNPKGGKTDINIYTTDVNRRNAYNDAQSQMRKNEEIMRMNALDLYLGKPAISRKPSLSKNSLNRDGLQAGGVFRTQAEVDAANALAQRFAVEQGSIAGRNAYVARNIGDPVPQFIDSRTNKPYIPSPTRPLSKTVPSFITNEDIQSADGLYWYNDPYTGDVVDIDPNVVFASPRFKQLAQKEIDKKSEERLSMASLRKGGIHIKPQNRGKFTDYCGGKVTGECIQKGLNSPSPSVRKMANFARNARKFKH